MTSRPVDPGWFAYSMASWLAVQVGLATLPEEVRWVHVVGAGLLAGIGFTVALFITQLAFADPELVAQGEIGILGASLLAGVGGYLLLRFTSEDPEG